ncbi:MAG TPA: hypothetical protein VGE74_22615 [Gemmata sp.]
MTIPEPDLAGVYDWAQKFARAKACGNPDAEESLIDAGTDAILWAVEKCTCADSFTNFAKTAIRRWVARKLAKARKRRQVRPLCGPLPEQVEGRAEKPVKPMLIGDLPEDLAFVVRLYMVDGFTCRDIGHLTGTSHNTVNLKLKRAAAMLDPTAVAPRRRNGEKRLSAG